MTTPKNRRISTEYCVHSGTPSWHQRRAGHASAGAVCFWSKKKAEAFMRRERRRLGAHEPVFIVMRRRVRTLGRTLGLSGLSLRQIERVYTDPSAAHERAMRWKRLGLKSIRVIPTTSQGRRIFVLTAMASDAQVRKL